MQQQHAKAKGAVPPHAARQQVGESGGVGYAQAAPQCGVRPVAGVAFAALVSAGLGAAYAFAARKGA